MGRVGGRAAVQGSVPKPLAHRSHCAPTPRSRRAEGPREAAPGPSTGPRRPWPARPSGPGTRRPGRVQVRVGRGQLDRPGAHQHDAGPGPARWLAGQGFVDPAPAEAEPEHPQVRAGHRVELPGSAGPPHLRGIDQHALGPPAGGDLEGVHPGGLVGEDGLQGPFPRLEHGQGAKALSLAPGCAVGPGQARRGILQPGPDDAGLDQPIAIDQHALAGSHRLRVPDHHRVVAPHRGGKPEDQQGDPGQGSWGSHGVHDFGGSRLAVGGRHSTSKKGSVLTIDTTPLPTGS